MIIGIIGADDRAVAIGRLLHACGHQVSFSDPTPNHAALHAAEALDGLAAVSTPYQQGEQADALVLAVHWQDLDLALAALGTFKTGVVIDATRPPALPHGHSGAELLAHKLDNRHVVKAFVDDLQPGRPVRVAADDPEAREAIESVITTCGGTIEDYGPLSRAIEIERSYAQEHPLVQK